MDADAWEDVATVIRLLAMFPLFLSAWIWSQVDAYQGRQED